MSKKEAPPKEAPPKEAPPSPAPFDQTPSAGGCYTRDPITGELTLVTPSTVQE